MANRRFNQFLYSLRKGLTFLEGNFVVGATGAVGTVKGAGIASITKTGTGAYRITCQDAYYRYLAGTWGFIDPTGLVGSSGIVEVQIVGNPNTTAQSKYIDVVMRNAAGSAANPTQGLVFGFTAFLDNTSEVPANEK